ncbi:MAG: GNAT family N-acetyltransferase [Clostridia bacterium]|nr:GNAT family N-acetyltransferase [Clostridia bacterium]
MHYRLAEEKDIGSIMHLVASAVAELENRGILQWDDLYPAEEVFLSDIRNGWLYAGMQDTDIAVIYAVSRECDEQYANGNWKYPGSEYRVLHRLCVDPRFQNRGIAKETLRHIEEELRENGVETVRLDVFCNNPYALALYRRSGYEQVGTALWRKGTFYLMEKHL